MSGRRGSPSRAEIRAASKRSAERVAAWNKDNVILTEKIADVIVTLTEIKVSNKSTFGPTAHTLAILCSLIPGAPDAKEAAAFRKLELVGAMLEAAKAASGVGGVVVDDGAEDSAGTDGGARNKPGGISEGDWAFMQSALAERQEGQALSYSDSSEGDSEETPIQVIGVGQNSMLFRYRTKATRELSKRAVFDGVSKDLAMELLYVEEVKSTDPAVVRQHYQEIAACLPLMLKKSSISAADLAQPGKIYVRALEKFLQKHRSWKQLVVSKHSRKRARVKEKEEGSSGSDVRKPVASKKFARKVKQAEEITLRDVAKGSELANIFEEWRVSSDKALPHKALKFIGKEVAAPSSKFAHPEEGVYNVFVSAGQMDRRDEKLRNIFEDVVYKFIPSREIRRNEFEAAEALRDRGGQLAKDARKRREKSELKLLARLAVECELCMMGAKSWAAYDEALRGDGVVEAIQAAFQNSSASDSEDGISRKAAHAAWTKARAVKITPPRAKKGKYSSGGESQSIASAMKSGFAALRSALANGNEGGNGGWSPVKSSSANQPSRVSADFSSRDCWHCGKKGHAWWEKGKCKLAGKDPAPGTVHAAKGGKP